MGAEDEILVQLATRVPRTLHRNIKLFCVGHGISVMEFVADALATKLQRARGRPGRARSRGRGRAARRR